MIFPDQSHINRVRDALWQRPNGCASVMVGAGFSRNARRSGPAAGDFPLWHEVATSLCTDLYPAGENERLTRAVAEAAGTSGFLRLAQEYEVAFGRDALHRLIRRLVPDDDYNPDDIHIRLLRLPWKDVFTTNWDTLLERTRVLVADQAYSVVRIAEELPSAPRPRIVKLHGTFPAHIPFIFTEEDYRTYPKRFAPFVNTVQQAMMETVMLLMGFSGDDPNFLHWSGWVRDNLGESSPKIYLAGWLDLSPHRRRMLEDRNVVPIDLARHPQAYTWPDHLRHRYATDWILHTLEHGQPYEIADWPSLPVKKPSPIPEFLQPVELVTVDVPTKEPDFPVGSAVPGSTPANVPELVRAAIRTWEHNRKVYPKWLFLPPKKQHLLERSTDAWEPSILKVAPDLPAVERLFVMRELIWRYEILLAPPPRPVEELIEKVLASIDCEERTVEGSKLGSAPWADIRSAWRDLTLALLTGARHRFDRATFDQLVNNLHPFLNDHPDVSQRIHHEKCLWALYCIDFAALDEALKDWRPEGCDPIWMTRKAALLVDLDRNDEVVRLLNRSLSIIREAPHSRHNLASASREGWTLWLALAFDRTSGFAVAKEVVDAPPVFRRWTELATVDCDAFAQMQAFLREIRGDSEKKDGPLFDLGARRGQSINLSSNAEFSRWMSGRRAVRLCEVAALPKSAAYTSIASDLLALATDNLARTEFLLAMRLALHLATSEDHATFNRIWARSRIAAIPPNDVTTFVQVVEKAVAYALPRVVGGGTRPIFWITKLRVALEALSRLVLRLSEEKANDIFCHALKYYRIDAVARDPWLSKPIKNLLVRSWEALPKSKRSDHLFDIFSAPIAGLDGFVTSQAYYPDPCELVVNDSEFVAPVRNSESDGRWSEVVQLVTRGLRGAADARKRAALRLITLSLWGILTDHERGLVAQALWRSGSTVPEALPNDISLHDWTFLVLPEPEPGIAERLFRNKWLRSANPQKFAELNEYFWHLGSALAGLKKIQRPLILTDEESKRIISFIEKWIALPLTSNVDPWNQWAIPQGVAGLQSILVEVDLSASVAADLLSRTLALNQTATPGFRLFAGLARSAPDRLADIEMSMRVGLASDIVEVAEEAVLGLHIWLRAGAEPGSKLPALPTGLLREIGVMIATRRKGVLNQALQAAQWLFSNGSAEQREAIANSALHGLRYLIEELRYDRDHGEDGEIEIPLLRWGCAHLALAMSTCGYDSDPIIVRWAQATKDDPLPEVRHVDVPTSTMTKNASPDSA